jgi:hypothetical protein
VIERPGVNLTLQAAAIAGLTRMEGAEGGLPEDAPAPGRLSLVTEPGEVTGWRFFGVAPDGVLFAPYGAVYFPGASEALRLWSSAEQGCGVPPLGPPGAGQGCTCGLRATVDREVLIAAAGRRPVAATVDSNTFRPSWLEGGGWNAPLILSEALLSRPLAARPGCWNDIGDGR